MALQNLKAVETEKTSPAVLPLNKLTAWDGNIRKTNPDANISELAASIEAHGLLQNIIVRQGKSGAYAVIAGQRRLRALQLLNTQGKIADDYQVKCEILGEGVPDLEISTAENVVREQIHPADQFEAFHAMAEAGTPVIDIAANFGVAENVVRQRLKLADVSPKIIEAYRAGNLTLQQVMAFAVTDDHERQEEVFAQLRGDRDAEDIRASLTEGTMNAADRRVKFVTLAAYRIAGGKESQDLFTQDDRGIFIHDTDKVDQLVEQQMESEKQKILAEGWKWAEVIPDFSWKHESEMRLSRRDCDYEPLSKDAKKQIAALQKEFDKLGMLGWGEMTDEQEARHDDLEKQIEKLEQTPEIWPDSIKAEAGVVLSIDKDGALEIQRGFVKPEDIKAAKKAEKKETKAERKNKSADDDEGEDKSAAFSAIVTEELKAHKTHGIQAVLASNPEIGLAVVVFTLASQVFDIHEDCSLDITPEVAFPPSSLESPGACKGYDAIEAMRKEWLKRLPKKQAGKNSLWNWTLEQDQETLLQLLAFCGAVTLSAAWRADDHATQVAQALGVDMKAWFTPTAENFFGGVNKLQTFAAMKEALKIDEIPQAWTKMKKAELASFAEREIAAAGGGWLPEMMRIPAPKSETKPAKKTDKKPKAVAAKKPAKKTAPKVKVTNGKARKPSKPFKRAA